MKNNHLIEKHTTGSISVYIRRLVIVSTVVTTILIAATISIHEIRTFNQIRAEQRESYLNEQELFIKDLVDGEVEYLHNQKKIFDLDTEQTFKQNVLHAYNIALEIYDQYNGTLPSNELKKLIIRSVSSLQPPNKYSQVFINTLDGQGVFYPGKPIHADKKLIDLKDINGNYVVKNEIELLNNQDEGFIKYGQKPHSSTNGNPHNKVVFVKKFGHFNWYFGSKGYLEDYHKAFENEIAHKISSVRFRHGGYIFINEISGTPIVLNGEVYQGDFNFFDGSDSIKQAVFELELNTALASTPEGGYFSYFWEKINANKPSPKTSYVKLFEPCNWLVGAGYYLDEIDILLDSQQKKLKNALTKDLLRILFILIAILTIQLFIIYRFNKKYKQDFLHFNRFFKLGRGRYKTIDVEKLHFEEFKQMGVIANEMINEQKNTHAQLVTEQKRAMESDRLKTAFLANMSHEIRTPMNSILGFSELLGDASLDCETKQDFTKIIIENGQHLLALINDIIDISKIESGQLTISKNKFRLNSLIDNIENHFQRLIESNDKTKIKFDVSTKLPINYLCNSDEFRLKQVLVNLIGNAIKFTQRGSVKLTVTRSKGKLIFKVSDTGIGISMEDQGTIFERFIQAKKNSKMNYGGTGLGLAISKNIINILGGEIGVKSKLGKGSEFYFHIPA